MAVYTAPVNFEDYIVQRPVSVSLAGFTGVTAITPIDITGTIISLKNTAAATVTSISTDTSLAGDSDTALVTQHAIKTYVDAVAPLSNVTFTAPLVRADDNVTLQNDTDTAITTVSTSETLVENSDTIIPTQRAVKAYVDAMAPISNVTFTAPLVRVGDNVALKNDAVATITAVSTAEDLAADSNTIIPTQHAVKYYVDSNTYIDLTTYVAPIYKVINDVQLLNSSGAQVTLISTDTALTNNSDTELVTQKAIKTYVASAMSLSSGSTRFEISQITPSIIAYMGDISYMQMLSTGLTVYRNITFQSEYDTPSHIELRDNADTFEAWCSTGRLFAAQAGAMFINGSVSLLNTLQISLVNTSSALEIWNDTNKIQSLNVTEITEYVPVHIADTTDASSLVTGSLITAGGAAITKTLYVGTNSHVYGSMYVHQNAADVNGVRLTTDGTSYDIYRAATHLFNVSTTATNIYYPLICANTAECVDTLTVTGPAPQVVLNESPGATTYVIKGDAGELKTYIGGIQTSDLNTTYLEQDTQLIVLTTMPQQAIVAYDVTHRLNIDVNSSGNTTLTSTGGTTTIPGVVGLSASGGSNSLTVDSNGNIRTGSGRWKSNCIFSMLRDTGTSAYWSQIGSLPFYGYRFNKGNSLGGALQLPHDIMTDSQNVYISLHWETDSTNTGNVHWQLQFNYAAEGDAHSGTITTSDIIVPGPGTAYIHNASYSSLLTFPGLAQGGQFLFAIERVNDTSDTFTWYAYLTGVCMHYQTNMVIGNESSS